MIADNSRSEQNRQLPDWVSVYDQADVTRMPWYHPDLDPDVAQAIDDCQLLGLSPHPLESGHPTQPRLLDLGTGPATQAAALARLGFTVTGSDVSPAAIERARLLYPDCTFVVDDILNTRLDTGLAAPFDVVLDRGCFHLFDEADRSTYVATVRRLLKPEGLLWLKCFSVEEPGDDGPYRYSVPALEAVFGGCFRLVSVEPTVYYGQLDPFPKALFSIWQAV